MSTRRWSVQNRPSVIVVQGALYGFLTGATIVGGVVFAIAADQVRKYRNERRLEWQRIRREVAAAEARHGIDGTAER